MIKTSTNWRVDNDRVTSEPHNSLHVYDDVTGAEYGDVIVYDSENVSDVIAGVVATRQPVYPPVQVDDATGYAPRTDGSVRGPRRDR